MAANLNQASYHVQIEALELMRISRGKAQHRQQPKRETIIFIALLSDSTAGPPFMIDHLVSKAQYEQFIYSRDRVWLVLTRQRTIISLCFTTSPNTPSRLNKGDLSVQHILPRSPRHPSLLCLRSLSVEIVWRLVRAHIITTPSRSLTI